MYHERMCTITPNGRRTNTSEYMPTILSGISSQRYRNCEWQSNNTSILKGIKTSMSVFKLPMVPSTNFKETSIETMEQIHKNNFQIRNANKVKNKTTTTKMDCTSWIKTNIIHLVSF